MSTVDIQNTVTLLNDLSKNSGHFIIDCGPYYVQLAKEAESPNICFEAVSHNFNHLVPKTIQAKLEDYV